MVFSKFRAATRRWIFPHFSRRCNICSSSPGPYTDGGFIQEVYIFREQNPKIIWHGTVLLDPGNSGPNLVTEEAMRSIGAEPNGPGMMIATFDGEERMTDGEVKLSFHGPGPKSRCYRETFHHVHHIIDGIDMVLNHEFYISVFPKKVPGILMIRRAKGKIKTEGTLHITLSQRSRLSCPKEQEQRRKEREGRQEANAQRQAAERQEEVRAAEERRQAQEAEYYYNSNPSSGGYSGSSDSYTNESNNY